MASVMSRSRSAVGAAARMIHTSAAARASPELVGLVQKSYLRRAPEMASTEEAASLSASLEEAMKAVGAPSAFVDLGEASAARATATSAALALARLGPDTSSLPVSAPWDVASYKHLGSGPLSGFTASELFQGSMVILGSGEDASDLLASIAAESTSRVDEFPVHALRAMSAGLVVKAVPAKAFVRAATVSVARRAHVALLSDSIGLLRAAMDAGVGADELAREAGTTLAATAESGAAESALPRAQLAEAAALIVAAAPADFLGDFAAWAAALVRREAATFSAADLERLVGALERVGAAQDSATKRALAVDAARRERDAAAEAANGFAPEDYGVVSDVVRA